MICLDTNYLIRCLEPGSEEAERIMAWYRRGERLLAPMPAWYELLCGPVTPEQEEIMRGFLAEVIPFAEAQAREASCLFNAAGRKRSLRVDAMIAATALVAGARLATGNQHDFTPFLAHGLERA
ncbi:MAG: PIN domain-containing protein [Chthoniobacterales bacterium]|nr:PIN domain-containing protein [Chthoniobacterales bacterium]